MTSYHLAQLNVARARADLADPSMAGFVDGLPRLNALADAAPGFVWRLQGDGEPDATSLRPFGSDIMVNMSLWTSVEALREYVYRGPHLEPLRRRAEWFHHDGLDPYTVLWWIPAGTLPTLDDAWRRLERLGRDGPGPDAFTLRRPWPPPETAESATMGHGVDRDG